MSHPRVHLCEICRKNTATRSRVDREEPAERVYLCGPCAGDYDYAASGGRCAQDYADDVRDQAIESQIAAAREAGR